MKRPIKTELWQPIVWFLLPGGLIQRHISEEEQVLEALTLTALSNRKRWFNMVQACQHRWPLIQHFKSMVFKLKPWRVLTTSPPLCKVAQGQALQLADTKAFRQEVDKGIYLTESIKAMLLKHSFLSLSMGTRGMRHSQESRKIIGKQ